MTAYTVSEGDDFETISRKQFGSVDKASSILSANPGASNPPTPGTTLFIPKVNTPVAPVGASTDITSLVVDGSSFVGWTDIQFTRSMDSFGTFSFNSVFEPENSSFRSVFRPFGYQSVAVFNGSDLLFNGTMTGVSPSESKEQRTVRAEGYSLPGVLNDCSPPISALPLERDAQDLKQIATALLDPFGLNVVFDGDPGPAFDREAIEPTDKIYNYLIKLAQQRNLIITDTPEGDCKFQTETTVGSPVATINEGDPAIISIVPTFGTQDYYSHVSGQSETLYGGVTSEPGNIYTVINPRLSGSLRPFTFKPPDTLTGDNKAAVEAKAGRMFASAATYRVAIPSWRDPNGNLWDSNTTIKIDAPGAMIYGPYEFLIRSVQFRKTAAEETALLTLVLPGVFSGKIPESLPWEG